MPSSSSSTRVFLAYEEDDEEMADRLRLGLRNTRHDLEVVDSSKDVDVVLVLVPRNIMPGLALTMEAEVAGRVRLPIIPVLLEPADAVPRVLSRHKPARLGRSSWDADVEALAGRIARLRAVGLAEFRKPYGLPPPVKQFVDRVTFVERIERELVEIAHSPDPAIVSIVGRDGVGKTALAIHVAHRVADQFPDGLLYAQLGIRAELSTTLRHFLEAMGVPGPDMPASLSGLATLYRSMLEGRSVLVLLDDVVNSKDVEFLFPPGEGSAMLLTGRIGLPYEEFPPGTRAVLLDEGLPPEYALDLLRATAGPEFVDEDPQRARDLVDAVDGSPLALSLIGAQGRQRGASAIAALTAGLRQLPDGAAREVLLERVYEALPDGDKRLFRLFGALPAQDFEPGVVAALADASVDGIAVQLRALIDAVLIEQSSAGRFRLSDLVSRFAAARFVAEEPEAERQAALGRAVQWMTTRMSFRTETPITRDFWTIDDTLGYGAYADAIASFVRHQGTLPPLTIGITAPWGAGKTSLMRMVQQRLDPRDDTATWTPKELRLSDDARKALRRGSTTSDYVTNAELLERTSEPADVEVPQLDVRPPRDDPKKEWRPTVWFNPWMYQSGEQIWAGLAYEIINQVTGRLSAGDRERFWLGLNLRRLDRQALRRRIYRQIVDQFLPSVFWLGLALVLAAAGLLVALVLPPAAHFLRTAAAWLVSISSTAAGVGAIVAAGRFLRSRAAGSFGPLLHVPNPVKSAEAQAGRPATGTFAEMFADPAYENRLGFLHLVHTDMRRALDLVATPSRPLVVFVDDLDRCSPSAVVQVIEAINLFLAGEFPNCIFVLAMEPAVVAAHVEAVYKDLAAHPVVSETSTLGWRFLEKIVQLPLSLPPPDSGAYLDSLLKGQPAAPLPPPATPPGTSPPAEPEHRSQPVATRTTAPSPSTGTSPEDLVGDIEQEIRLRRPTLDTLASAALAAQAALVEGSVGTLLPETSEAANRVLIELYSDGEARTAIIAGVPGLASDNPREIKRFVNLFRFYTFIAQEQQLQGHAAVSGAEIAKLSVFAIRWPHLLGALGRRTATTLGKLEASLDRGDDEWAAALREAGLTAAGEHLRAFLASQPPIAAAADRIL